jgi:membrane associated rhomboid family serine protease
VFNIPPFTKYLLGLILGMYFITGVILEPRAADFVYDHFGLVPEKFWTDAFDVYTIISPFTHILLHGSWMHVIMNVFMLAAFGSGVERWLGFKHTMILFIASAFFGAALHFVLNTFSPFPMIGASGGISGLFAAAIVMMNKGGQELALVCWAARMEASLHGPRMSAVSWVASPF